MLHVKLSYPLKFSLLEIMDVRFTSTTTNSTPKPHAIYIINSESKTSIPKAANTFVAISFS